MKVIERQTTQNNPRDGRLFVHSITIKTQQTYRCNIVLNNYTCTLQWNFQFLPLKVRMYILPQFRRYLPLYDNYCEYIACDTEIDCRPLRQL